VEEDGWGGEGPRPLLARHVDQARQQEHHHQAARRSTVWQAINQMRVLNKTGEFFWIFALATVFSTASSSSPHIPLCREDAGIEPRTVATSALTARRSNHSARSHPQLS
jgi:hypothetical protein